MQLSSVRRIQDIACTVPCTSGEEVGGPILLRQNKAPYMLLVGRVNLNAVLLAAHSQQSFCQQVMRLIRECRLPK
jgi:hypothetical protein